MPDAYFDSNLNGNLRTSPATRTLAGNVAIRPTEGNLLAVTAATYYLDTGISTFKTNTVIRTLTGNVAIRPTEGNLLAVTAATYYLDTGISTFKTNTVVRTLTATLPYRVTRSPTIKSRFTD